MPVYKHSCRYFLLSLVSLSVPGGGARAALAAAAAATAAAAAAA